jgi:hypothetical protein
MVNICCRICGGKLEVMAICIKCGREILYGCLRCVIFSDTLLHVNCLDPRSIIYDNTHDFILSSDKLGDKF